MRIRPADPGFGQLVDLFDEYRVHYGEEPAPERTAAWLSDQLGPSHLQASVAIENGHALGFITTAVLPASLRLATFWMVRDLFVRPGRRRTGAGRALLDHVVAEAGAAGALRISLQTEPENASALALYTTAGFHPVDGLTSLSLPLSAPA
jgi:GNAT superfamily N-acetyltransferase